jgi:hypothetical protein
MSRNGEGMVPHLSPEAMTMNKMTTLLHSATVALLVGALAVPGLALARDHGDRHGHGDWHGHGERHSKHWRHHDRGWRGDRVVVVEQPVYRARRTAVVAAPLWAPLTNGITVVLGTHW